MAKSSPSKLEPREFGDFTRERVVTILKNRIGTKSQAVTNVAAGLLAGLDPQGPRPAYDLIDVALDVLAGGNTAMAGDLLWQAAEHAQNSRIRVEAIRRSGPIATPERSSLLRTWATDGFSPIVNYQHDQIDINSIKTAAITALGTIRVPSRDDIETIMVAITPLSDKAKFSPVVFSAACGAYWSAGDVKSLPKLVEVASSWSRTEMGAHLTALAAKFSTKELKPHADELRKAFLECADKWPDDSLTADRLLTLADKLATTDFFQDWSSRYGKDGLEHGRGRVTLKLLESLNQPTDGLARGLLILVRWSHHLASSGPVIQRLRQCVGAGHGKLVAQSIVSESHEGHGRLLESGKVFVLFDSIDTGMTQVCEAVSAIQSQPRRQQVAAAVATGGLDFAYEEATAGPETKKMDRTQRPQRQGEQKTLTHDVSVLEALDPLQNPVLVIARLLCPPTSSSGALDVCRSWLSPRDAIANYVIRVVIREAGQVQGFGQENPILTQFEQSVLSPEPQQAPLKPMLESALVSGVMVDGKVNRYAVDLVLRAGLSFEKSAETALNGIRTTEDAEFLLDRLREKGTSVIGVLAKGIRFHHDTNGQLTEYVRAKAISLVTELVNETKDRTQQDSFADQLHERFQDPLTVRQSAYHACGELGSFHSIKALRGRLSKETASSAKTAIEQAIADLRKRLIEERPQGGLPKAVTQWMNFVADLGDPALLPHVVGYLDPPHPDHSVRRSALVAVEHMPGSESLAVVKRFITDTAPEGETLAIARHARLVLEERNDLELFDVLSNFYSADEGVLDPAIDYANLLGTLLPSVTKGLQKSLNLFEDGHWDEFVARISGLMESVAKLVFRRRFSLLGIDQAAADKIARGPYRNLLNLAGFRNIYGKLQAHCDTIYAYRGESPTAHATHTDGSVKAEATSEDAEYIRDEFKLAFAEAVKALR